MGPFLTYEPFFGLKEKPFSLASDPAFFYNSASHRAAFDALDAGIRRREGLIVLSGEIGTGKTTLCRTVLSQLDRKTFSTFVPDPFVTREDLLKTLLIGFGVASVADVNGGRLQGASRQDLSYPLYEFLDSLVPLQAFAVLVIDEAQNLSLGVMEEIRILAELEKREKLLQVVLVGQPELRDNLRLPQMRQVEQRVTVRCELTPLAFRDVTEYVQHRLQVAAAPAGATDTRAPGVEFTGGAVEAVHLASGGVPRLINLACDRALQRAFEARRRTIDRDLVSVAVRDLDLDERTSGADVGAADILPLPFEPALELEPVRASAPAAMAATTPPEPKRAPAGGVSSFEPEPPPAPRPEPSNPLSEFDSEPEGTMEHPSDNRSAAALLAAEPAARSVVWTLARALGFATAALGIAVGAGVLNTRAAYNLVAPDVPAALPVPPDRDAVLVRTALAVPDTLTVAFTDARAHEPDVFSAQAATFRDRQAADALVAELTGQGFRARWAEVRVDDTDAVQQVFVDGYGTLENALVLVGRLRGRASTAGTTLFRQPGAVRRQDFR